MAKQYSVFVKEMHYSRRIVEAETEAEAKELAENEAEWGLIYSDTCDPEEWIVKEILDPESPLG